MLAEYVFIEIVIVYLPVELWRTPAAKRPANMRAIFAIFLPSNADDVETGSKTGCETEGRYCAIRKPAAERGFASAIDRTKTGGLILTATEREMK